MSIIKINNISKKFGNKILYDNISLNVEKGTTVGVVGSNGTGKSVLFKIIAGLEDVDSGEVYVKENIVGTDYDFPDNIGLYVNQPGYIDFYDGFTNLKLLAEIKSIISDEEIKKSMERVGLDPEDKTKVKNYSTGMKQKLGITQAVMEKQDLILLDEPFNALDFQTNAEMISIIRDLKKDDKTLLLTSHQHEYLEKVCDEIYILLNKKLILFDDEIKKKYFSID